MVWAENPRLYFILYKTEKILTNRLETEYFRSTLPNYNEFEISPSFSRKSVPGSFTYTELRNQRNFKTAVTDCKLQLFVVSGLGRKRQEGCTLGFGGVDPRGSNHLENLGVDTATLEWIFKYGIGKTWTGLI
jgi:hypothetical protein